MPVADLDALDRFLAEPRNVLVVGLRSDGRPHGTPNWFLWQDGRFYVSTTKQRAKHRIFSHDPRVQLVIDDSMGFRYVIVDGTVEVSDDIDLGLGHFAALRAKHGRGGVELAELRAEMERDGRVTLIITPDTAPERWLAMGL